MAVKRWVLKDPHDSSANGTYTFPRNPREMSSPYPERALTPSATTFGRILLWEGPIPAKQFTFAGPILEKSHFDKLREWVYEHQRRIYLYDHFGRRITTVFQSIDLVPQRRLNYYYSHEYTVSALAIKVSEPTVPNTGYRP